MSSLLAFVFSWKFVAWSIPSVAAIYGCILHRRSTSIEYSVPSFKILKSLASPAFQPVIEVAIINPSNFENCITHFELRPLSVDRPSIPIAKGEIDIKLPKTTKKTFEINLKYEAVESLRGRNAVLTLTDLRRSSVSKNFIFVPSYHPRKAARLWENIIKSITNA